MDPCNDPRLNELISLALGEDLGDGDATSNALVDPGAQIEAELVAREPCRVAGTQVGRRVFECVDEALRVETLLPDGCDAPPGGAILRIRGPARGLLSAERTALNFMQRMTGIATLTATFVQAVRPWGTRILDTRKTTPGLRFLEKYSVRCGGGENHRMGLYDRVLIKDNHRKLWHGGNPDRLDLAVEAARRAFPSLAVEVEVESLEELHSALRAKPEWILLDNMSQALLAECVAAARGISLTEASGGITMENVCSVATTGVDAISLGCLTHSARSVDLSLEWTQSMTDADLGRDS